MDDLDDEEDWLDGLRAAGLPVRHPARPAGPSPGLRHLLDEATPTASAGLRELVANSVAASTRAAYEKDWRDFALESDIQSVCGRCPETRVP
jgi:hypothetical protein